ncbi:hypothetical protein VSU19_21445 [Verrucomicrobiales bacterium BCK34]|nr:hypothetical protein [Verrucomicrobiales bacterium BCK34]
MMKHSTGLSLPFFSLLILSGAAVAQVPEGILPASLEEGDFNSVRDASPFTRVLSISETYALRGVAELGAIQYATLYNREKKETILVSPEGGQIQSDDPGIKLVQIVPARSLDGVAAKISFAGEEVELKYDTEQIAPTPAQGSSDGRRDGDRRGGDDGRHKGPSKEDIDRFRALPEEKQKKLREYIGHVMKSYPEMSRSEKGNLIRGAMIKLTDGRDIDMPGGDGGGRSGGDSSSKGKGR